MWEVWPISSASVSLYDACNFEIKKDYNPLSYLTKGDQWGYFKSLTCPWVNFKKGWSSFDIKDSWSSRRVMRNQSFCLFLSLSLKKKKKFRFIHKGTPFYQSSLGTQVVYTTPLLSDSTRHLSFELRLSQLLIIPNTCTDTGGVKVNMSKSIVTWLKKKWDLPFKFTEQC